jgi:heterodisulfide reductase subunit A
MKERESGTKKAQDLIRMGVARALLLEPKEEIVADVLPTALVIGGGISGLTAASALGNRGFKVWLIEREEKLGGTLKNLYRLYPSQRLAQEVLEEKCQEVLHSPQITIYTGARVLNIKGYIGNYTIATEHQGEEKELQVGVILVATGTNVLVPEEGTYGYGHPQVITQLALEKRLQEDDLSGINRVVMIQCVGAMSLERVYCSKICCMTAIKNAILIKEQNPEAQVYILYRDIQAYGTTYEEYLRKAREMGIRFINYHPQSPPQVKETTVTVYHQLWGRELTIPADLIVLATPLIPQTGVEELSKMLKVPLDQDKFFLEAHVKLNPVDFATDGIYICGSAHWPTDTTESITQALAAAARASIHLTREYVKVEPIVSSLIDQELCRGCGMCAALCPYGAIEMRTTPHGEKAHMIEVACKGCGVCGSTCYVQAIRMNHYTNDQIAAQIAAFAD